MESHRPCILAGSSRSPFALCEAFRFCNALVCGTRKPRRHTQQSLDHRPAIEGVSTAATACDRNAGMERSNGVDPMPDTPSLFGSCL
jgi:hypothetical protein